jgi:hypothetical protein
MILFILFWFCIGILSYLIYLRFTIYLFWLWLFYFMLFIHLNRVEMSTPSAFGILFYFFFFSFLTYHLLPSFYFLFFFFFFIHFICLFIWVLFIYLVFELFDLIWFDFAHSGRFDLSWPPTSYLTCLLHLPTLFISRILLLLPFVIPLVTHLAFNGLILSLT